MKCLFASDLVILGYLSITSLLVLIAQPPLTLVYLGAHGLATLLIFAVAWIHVRFLNRFWTFLRYWLPLILVLACYRELHYLIPDVHPFADRRFDQALAGLDRAWFGNVDGFCLSLAHPFLIDGLFLCYVAYFPMMVVPGVVFYARGEFLKFREYSAVLLTALFVSYLGYFAVPAIGPHHFFHARPPELGGWMLGRPLHQGLLALELETADAFPSGHALASIVVAIMTWKLARETFWVLILPLTGCLAATVLLRYHYLVDVLASLVLLPVALWVGHLANRWVEGPGYDGEKASVGPRQACGGASL